MATQNRGEKVEVGAVKELFEADSADLIKLFGEEASEGIEICNPVTKTPYSSVEAVVKAPSSYKADVVIRFRKTGRFIYVSIKSHHNPAIVNHTRRGLRVFQDEGEMFLQSCLPLCDEICGDYHNEVKQGKGEDIRFIDLPILKKPLHKEAMVKVLLYFMFEGTGSRLSKCPANSVLHRNKDGTLTYEPCDTLELKQEYVRGVFDSCVISFRSKGLSKKKKHSCDEPWCRDVPGKNGEIKRKGAMHIRIKPQNTKCSNSC